METIKERINKILAIANLNPRKLSEIIGVSVQSIYDIQSGKVSSLSMRMRERICAKFPNISPLWLATGEGDMLRSASNVQHIDIEQNNIINSDNTNNVGDDMMGAALAEIAAQRRLTEKAQEQLMAAQRLTEKAQAHIDRLLSIIDRLTNE